MARRIEFAQGDVHLAGAMFETITAKPGRLARLGGARRWLVLVPASGSPEVRIEINADDGDPDAMNLVVNNSAVEPGRPAYPEIAERGVTTPSGWRLMADVGWVLGWVLPLDTPLEQVAGHGFRVTRALAGEPPDGLWRATIEKRPPRPGFTNPQI